MGLKESLKSVAHNAAHAMPDVMTTGAAGMAASRDGDVKVTDQPPAGGDAAKVKVPEIGAPGVKEKAYATPTDKAESAPASEAGAGVGAAAGGTAAPAAGAGVPAAGTPAPVVEAVPVVTTTVPVVKTNK